MSKWHEFFTKHDSRMAMAESLVEDANYWKRAGNPSKGWRQIQAAIALVVDCGCPRETWPLQVQEVIQVGRDG